jgi:hypothetical protein
MTTSDLIRQISELCPDLRPPAALALFGGYWHPEYEGWEEMIEGRSWREIDYARLAPEYDMLACLTCEAESFYMPAFLEASVMDFPAPVSVNLIDSLWQRLIPNKRIPDALDAMRRCFASMTPEVRGAAGLWIRWIIDGSGWEREAREAQNALDAFWNQF